MSLGNIYYRGKVAQRRLRHNQGDGRSLAILVLAATSIFLLVGLTEIILYANPEPDEPAYIQVFPFTYTPIRRADGTWNGQIKVTVIRETRNVEYAK